MRKLLALALFFGFACSNPHNQTLPTDLPELKAALETPQFKATIEKLPQEERELLGGYLAREMIGKAFGADPTAGARTVGDAIVQQRKFEEAEKTKEAAATALAAKVAAERAVATKAMDDVLTVAFTSKKVVPKDIYAQRFSDTIEMAVAFQNKSAKTLSGVKGVLVFKDIFGDLIRNARLKFDDEIGAGETHVWNGSMEINQFEAADMKLAQTSQDKLKVTWEPDTYLFSDGTSLRAPPTAD